MGTNYYHEIELCDKCHNANRTHIGKSSHGWTFSFHATDEIRSWKDWQAKLAAGGRIVDEYGEVVALETLIEMVERKRKPWGPQGRQSSNHAAMYGKGGTHVHEYGQGYAASHFLDPEGHSFSEGEFS